MIALVALALATGTADTLRYRPEDIDSLPAARVQVDQRRSRLIVELPVVEVPPGKTARSPVYRVPVPFTVSLHGFTVEVVDDAGQPLPVDQLHHVVFTDPNRRELFLPLVLPIFAASKESPRPRLPKYRVGMILPRGNRYLVAAMFQNTAAAPKRMVVRLMLSFIRPTRIVPQVHAYAWTLDVSYPLGREGGRHDFDLPPGRSSFSWQASPQIPGTIIAMGAHAHDHATAIQFEDVTTGRRIYHTVPERDTAGSLVRIAPTRFANWHRAGIHITPSHTYRVTVFYDNPTGETIRFGGMGSVAGLFVPDDDEKWPRVDPSDPIYRAQINNLLSNMAGLEMAESRHH